MLIKINLVKINPTGEEYKNTFKQMEFFKFSLEVLRGKMDPNNFFSYADKENPFQYFMEDQVRAKTAAKQILGSIQVIHHANKNLFNLANSQEFLQSISKPKPAHAAQRPKLG